VKLRRDDLPALVAGLVLGPALMIWAALDQERFWVRLGIGFAVTVVILAIFVITPRRWFVRRRKPQDTEGNS
jgi:uncharacterized membrane protein (UPF0136 family)